MDVRKPKRRMYACLHCERGQKFHVSERYRKTAHVYRNHLALDQAPFFCMLCQFRCMTMGALEKHATQPKHVSDARARGGEPRRFLGQNFNPKVVMEHADFRLATDEESLRRGTILPDDSQFDEEEVDSVEAGTELINIQVTPQMLAELMAGKVAGQPEYTPTPKVANQYDPAVPSYSGQLGYANPQTSVATLRRPVSTANSGAGFAPLDMRTSPKVAPSATSTVMAPPFIAAPVHVSASLGYVAPTTLFNTVAVDQGLSGDAYLPSFGDTFITTGLDSAPSTPPTTIPGVTMKDPPPQANTCILNTPVTSRTPLDFTGTPEVEDIKEQLLGRDEINQSFSPIPSKCDKAAQTKVSHTKTDLTPTAASMAITHLDETLRVALEKIYSAVERNSRRIEEVNKTVGTLADSLSRIERSMDHPAIRRNTQDRRGAGDEANEKRPRLECKENQPPRLSSVVKDPKQTRRSGK